MLVDKDIQGLAGFLIYSKNLCNLNSASPWSNHSCKKHTVNRRYANWGVCVFLKFVVNSSFTYCRIIFDCAQTEFRYCATVRTESFSTAWGHNKITSKVLTTSGTRSSLLLQTCKVSTAFVHYLSSIAFYTVNTKLGFYYCTDFVSSDRFTSRVYHLSPISCDCILSPFKTLRTLCCLRNL